MFRTSRHLRSLVEVIQKKSTSLTDILEPLQLQKNVQDLQALWEYCKSHKRISTSLQTFLIFYNFRKICRYSRSLLKVIQNYLKAWHRFRSVYNFRKMFVFSCYSRSLVKVIQKYLQIWWTFWNFYNFRKIFKRFRKRWKKEVTWLKTLV